MTNTDGNFREIGKEMNDAMKNITRKGKDIEIRVRRDGTFDVFELERRKCKPPQEEAETEE